MVENIQMQLKNSLAKLDQVKKTGISDDKYLKKLKRNYLKVN